MGEPSSGGRDGPGLLSILVTIPGVIPEESVGALAPPVRLVRQLRRAGAGGAARFVVDAGEMHRWREIALREEVDLVNLFDLSADFGTASDETFVYAPGTLVLSGEGLSTVLNNGAMGQGVAFQPDGAPAGFGIGKRSPELLRWAEGVCRGERDGALAGSGAFPIPQQSILGWADDGAAAAALDSQVMDALSRRQDPNFARLTKRCFSKKVSRPLAAAGVRPNTVTLMAIAVGLLAAGLVFHGGWLWTLAGATALVVSRLLDDCDGEVARMTLRQTAFGARIDVAGDIVVHTSVFLALALQLQRTQPQGHFLLALALLVVGGAVSTLLILRGVTGTDLAHESRTARALERSASGDFAYLFWLVAVLGISDWFLWLCAVGSHFFWITLAVLIWRHSRRQAPAIPIAGRGWDVLLFGSGLALLIVLVARTGPATIAADIALVGWAFMLVLAAEIPSIVSSAVGWLYTISPQARRLSLGRLILFRVAAEGINHLTPTATIGGEFARARLATPYLGPTESAASVTLAKFTETAGQYLFIVTGLLALLSAIDGLGAYRPWLIGVVGLSLLGVALLYVLLHRGLFSVAARYLSALPFLRDWLAAQDERIRAIDAVIGVSLAERPSDLVASTLWLGFSFAARTFEVWLILRLLGVEAPLITCVGIEVLSALINSLFFFMPAKMGTQEGGKMLIFGLLGLPPEKGLVLGLVRRARELSWDSAGLMIYATAQKPAAPQPSRV